MIDLIELRTGFLEFIKTIGKSMYPHSLRKLGERKLGEAVSYLLSLVFVSFIIMSIFALPTLIGIGGYVNDQFSKVEELSIDINFKTTEPIIITERNPQIAIDTTGTIAEVNDTRALVTNEAILYTFFGRTRSINLTQFKDVKANKDEVTKNLLWLLLLILPSVIIGLYVIYLLKYIILILLVTWIVYGICRIFNLKLKFKRLLTMGIYASTIMVILEIIAIPFGLSEVWIPLRIALAVSVSLIPLALYIIMIAISAILTGSKEFNQ